jgi:hypothetical protein
MGWNGWMDSEEPKQPPISLSHKEKVLFFLCWPFYCYYYYFITLLIFFFINVKILVLVFYFIFSSPQ